MDGDSFRQRVKRFFLIPESRSNAFAEPEFYREFPVPETNPDRWEWMATSGQPILPQGAKEVQTCCSYWFRSKTRLRIGAAVFAPLPQSVEMARIVRGQIPH